MMHMTAALPHTSSPVERAMISAAWEAGKYIRQYAFDVEKVDYKKLDDPVTALDKAAERIIRDKLAYDAPGNFVGEEYGSKDNNSSRTYYIDPIDGTKSFILRDFNSCVSIGLEEGGELTGGIVYDFMRDIMYVGFRGECRVLRMDAQKEYDFRESATSNTGLSKPRISVDKAPHLVRLFEDAGYAVSEKGGSIALAMAQLAAGNIDGMVHNYIGHGNSWDVAAGTYLLKARNITMLDCYGREFDFKHANKGIIALRNTIRSGVLEELVRYEACNAPDHWYACKE
jgi:myo-inositol-1(or 4)-monophosphatase